MKRPASLLISVVVIVVLAAFVRQASPAHAATVVYAKGWHLVAAPAGTILAGAADPMYSLDPATGDYTTVAASQPVKGGAAYFAFFNDLSLVRMAADQHTPVSVALTAGAWAMIGNPSAYSHATVSGAELVYTYDQQGGWLVQSSVPPGQGALVYSYFGGIATITPNPGGIDTTLSVQEDKLVDLAVTTADVPANFALTRADTNGGQNGNIPVTYVVEFRPRTAPKPADPQQTTLVQVNIQQTKNLDYAALLLNGTTTDQLRQNLGSNVRAVDTPPAPPSIGDAARYFHVQIVNGNNQTGVYVLAFRTRQLFVTVQVQAPYNREDQDLLATLGRLQDARIRGAFSIAPIAPSAVHATAVDQTHVRVDWTRNSDNEDGFQVYDALAGKVAATVADNSVTYTVGSLAVATRYCFAVFAYNSFGNSAYSNQDCATTAK